MAFTNTFSDASLYAPVTTAVCPYCALALNDGFPGAQLLHNRAVWCLECRRVAYEPLDLTHVNLFSSPPLIKHTAALLLTVPMESLEHEAWCKQVFYMAGHLTKKRIVSLVREAGLSVQFLHLKYSELALKAPVPDHFKSIRTHILGDLLVEMGFEYAPDFN